MKTETQNLIETALLACHDELRYAIGRGTGRWRAAVDACERALHALDIEFTPINR